MVDIEAFLGKHCKMFFFTSDQLLGADTRSRSQTCEW